MRLLFKFFAWAVVLRWVYAELTLLAPFVVPYVDSALSYAELPTHNQWPKIELVSPQSEQDSERSSAVRLTFLDKIPAVLNLLQNESLQVLTTHTTQEVSSTPRPSLVAGERGKRNIKG